MCIVFEINIEKSMSGLYYSYVFDTLSWLLIHLQWNLSITTTSIMKFIPCDLFSNVF